MTFVMMLQKSLLVKLFTETCEIWIEKCIPTSAAKTTFDRKCVEKRKNKLVACSFLSAYLDVSLNSGQNVSDVIHVYVGV